MKRASALDGARQGRRAESYGLRTGALVFLLLLASPALAVCYIPGTSTPRPCPSVTPTRTPTRTPTPPATPTPTVAPPAPPTPTPTPTPIPGSGAWTSLGPGVGAASVRVEGNVLPGTVVRLVLSSPDGNDIQINEWRIGPGTYPPTAPWTRARWFGGNYSGWLIHSELVNAAGVVAQTSATSVVP
jgi:hypothetical protein